MGDDKQREAERQEVAKRVIETAGELENQLNGRLVVVRLAGVWFVENNVMGTAHVIVDTREVTPAEAVEEFPFQFILSALRMCLMQDYSFLKDKHVPDLAERTERFDNLVIEYGQIASEYVTRLRRVGDSPA